jgi:hypothetical protein
MLDLTPGAENEIQKETDRGMEPVPVMARFEAANDYSITRATYRRCRGRSSSRECR